MISFLQTRQIPASGKYPALLQVMRMGKLLVMGLLMGALWSCDSLKLPSNKLHEAKTQFEAGSTHIAVTYIEPWNNVASKLSPGFELKGDEALNKVIPQTNTAFNHFLENVSGNLSLSLGTDTSSNSSSMVQPSSLQAASSVRPNSTSEPLLQYSAALALFQEVQLLNRYIIGAPTSSDVVPYIVRLQVTLTPYAHYEPYDAYSSISFFVKTHKDNRLGKASWQPKVIPLMVTDSLEGIQTSTINESLLQFALSLSSIATTNQAKAELKKLTDSLRSTMGTELNSIQTIGRSSDNSILVRFGAIRSPVEDDAYVMVPRTHSVTLLLLAPKEWLFDQDNPRIKLVSRTRFYQVKTGEILKTITPDEVNAKLAELANDYMDQGRVQPAFYNVLVGKSGIEEWATTEASQHTREKISHDEDLAYCNEYYQTLEEKWRDVSNNDEKRKVAVLSHLYDYAGDQQYDCAAHDFRKYFRNPNDFYYLYNDLLSLTDSFGVADTTFELPGVPSALPPRQTALLSDDGVNSTIHLMGGHILLPDRLRATLEIDPGAASAVSPILLPSEPIAVDGQDMLLKFPSLSKWGIKGKSLMLFLAVNQSENLEDQPFGWCGCYEVLYAAPKPADPKAQKEDAGFTLSAVESIVVKDGSGQIDLHFAFPKDGADKVEVSVSDGEISSVSYSPQPDGKKTGPISKTGNTFAIPGKANETVSVTLSLRNLIEGEKLQLLATGYKAKTKLAVSTLIIELKAAKGRT